jgi:hypothetical protein
VGCLWLRLIDARYPETDAEHLVRLKERAREKVSKPAPVNPLDSRYEELNVLGTPTGKVAHVGEGEALPGSPRGFSWRHVAPEA